MLDADRTVHELLANNQETIDEITRAFGRQILSEDKSIDRKALGNLIFSNSTGRAQLEKILHPRVAKSMYRRQLEYEALGYKVCVWDVPLLFEAGFDSRVDEVWVVWVPFDIQKERVMRRDALTQEAVQLRIKAQLALDEKVKRANVVIDNSGTWQETEDQLATQLARIKREYEL